MTYLPNLHRALAAGTLIGSVAGAGIIADGAASAAPAIAQSITVPVSDRGPRHARPEPEPDLEPRGGGDDAVRSWSSPPGVCERAAAGLLDDLRPVHQPGRHHVSARLRSGDGRRAEHEAREPHHQRSQQGQQPLLRRHRLGSGHPGHQHLVVRDTVDQPEEAAGPRAELLPLRLPRRPDDTVGLHRRLRAVRKRLR